MKLISFSAKNYRSISDAYKLPLTDYTVIVGPNNEGKSNILKGLGLALSILADPRYLLFGRRTTNVGFKRNRMSGNRTDDYLRYDWERDFPINLQKSKPEGQSEFTCEFELSPTESEEFKRLTKIELNSNFKVNISIGKDSKPEIFIKKRSKKNLNKKKLKISEFVKDKISLQYIPAVRTSKLAINIVNELLEKELSTLEDKPEFKQVIKTIIKLQKPIIKKISANLKKTVKSFIPDVKSVSIKNADISELISASCRVYVNDGIETDLELKGDGVISLTAISLLQDFSRENLLNKGLILLLEEPESHLHPKAIHSLKKVLHEIATTSQVIITTHSPIMVERLNFKQNIIVQNRKAVSAENTNDIRNSLGIIMSDNLMNAEIVLLVEGNEDIPVLKSWLVEKSVKIRTAIKSGILVLDHLCGANNLAYKASLHKNNLCTAIAYLDNDEAGRSGVKAAEEKGIIKINEYTLSNCKGMKNSELEDLIDFSVYHQLIIDDYGVDLKDKLFMANRDQWSNRVKTAFVSAGKIWDSRLENEIKRKVLSRAVSLGLESLNIQRMNSINSLVAVIENMIDIHN